MFEAYDGVWGIPVAYQQPGLKMSRTSWGWKLKKPPTELVPEKALIVLEPQPRYIARAASAPAPSETAAVGSTRGWVIYRSTKETPYASFVRLSEAEEHPEIYDLLPNTYRFWPFVENTAVSATWPVANQVRVSGSRDIRSGHVAHPGIFCAGLEGQRRRARRTQRDKCRRTCWCSSRGRTAHLCLRIQAHI